MQPNSIMLALFSFVVLLLSALSVHTFPVSLPGSRVYIDATYGVPVGDGVTRFVVKYANSQRWKPSTPVAVQQILSLVLKVPASPLRQTSVDESRLQDLPPACPQSGSGPMSEDCLYMVVYVPNSINPGSNAPTLLWSVNRPTTSCYICSVSSFTGFMADHPLVAPRAIPQSMALNSHLQPNPLSRSPNTDLAQ